MVDETRTKAAAIGTSVAEGFIGLGAVTLAIIALAGVVPGFLLAIGVIAAGTALLFEGGAISGRFSMFHDVTKRGGTLTQFIIGIAVIALGVLGLIGVAPRALLPIAVILMGIGLILVSAMHMRMGTVGFQGTEAPMHEGHYPMMTREIGMMTVGMQAFIGVGVLTLGVLALIGVQPIMTLCLVAVLATGAALFFNSAAASAMFGWRS